MEDQVSWRALPRPHEAVEITMSDGARIWLRRHGNRDGHRVALSHGNGLAIDAYYGFWRHLLASCDVILFDIRTHGWNSWNPPEKHTWPRIVDDMEEIYHAIGTHFDDRPVTGVFHSLAAVAALKHTLTVGRRWSRLILFEPPLCPPTGHPLAPSYAIHRTEIAERAARRTQFYSSPVSFERQLLENPYFSVWPEGTHEVFARTTLRYDEEAGVWVLRCPREYEAHIFETNTDESLWTGLAGDLPVPVHLVCVDASWPDPDLPTVLCRTVAEEHGLDCRFVAATSHLLQLEAPSGSAQAVLGVLASQDV